MDEFVKNITCLVPKLPHNYYHTKFEDLTDFELIKKALMNRLNIKFQGPTGAGKTTTIQAYCAEEKIPHVVVNMKGTTSTEELIGAWSPSETTKGGFVWKHGLIPRTILYSQLFDEITIKKQNGKLVLPENHYIDITNGVICEEDIISEDDKQMVVKQYKRVVLTVEEINFSPEELMSVWFSLLDGRRNIVLGEKNGEVLASGKNMLVSATMNPDYVGTNKLNRALEDRFVIKLDVEYDRKVENSIINELGKKFAIHIDTIKVLLKFIKEVRKAKKNESISTDISTRMIRAYLELTGKVSPKIAYASLINSFDKMDQDVVRQLFDFSKKDNIDININDKELEGLDLNNFEGYKKPVPVVVPEAPKASKKASAGTASGDPNSCPW